MSAFMVSMEHINAMLQVTAPRYAGDCFGYYFDGEMKYFSSNKRAIGQKLLEQNQRSVNYRYDEDTPTPAFHHCNVRAFTSIEIIKLCNCYEYQSCETPDWKETEAYMIIGAIKKRATYLLPGYDEAPWTIP